MVYAVFNETGASLEAGSELGDVCLMFPSVCLHLQRSPALSYVFAWWVLMAALQLMRRCVHHRALQSNLCPLCRVISLCTLSVSNI